METRGIPQLMIASKAFLQADLSLMRLLVRAPCSPFGMNARLHDKKNCRLQLSTVLFIRLAHSETDPDMTALLNSSFSDLASEQ